MWRRKARGMGRAAMLAGPPGYGARTDGAAQIMCGGTRSGAAA